MRLQSMLPVTVEPLPGVSITLRPITRATYRIALRYIQENRDQVRDSDFAAMDAIAHALIAAGIEWWTGVDDDDGPAAVNPDNIEALLADRVIFDALYRDYVAPWFDRRREGNDLSASPSGTGVAVTPEKITVN